MDLKNQKGNLNEELMLFMYSRMGSEESNERPRNKNTYPSTP